MRRKAAFWCWILFKVFWLATTCLGTFQWWKEEVGCDASQESCRYVDCPFDRSYRCRKKSCYLDERNTLFCPLSSRHYDQIENMIAEIGYEMGWLCVIDWALLLLCSCKHVPWMKIFSDQPFEDALDVHKWVGHVSILELHAHAILYVIVWMKRDQLWVKLLSWSHSGTAYLPGAISWIIFGVLGAFALEVIRRRNYSWFYYSHWLYVPGLAFAFLHSHYIFFWVFGGFAVYLADKIMLEVGKMGTCEVTHFWCAQDRKMASFSISSSSRLSNRESPFEFASINFPQVSRLEWHPFSIAFKINENSWRFYVKASESGWCRRVIDFAQDKFATGEKLLVNAIVPLGGMCIQDADQTCFIAGGSGITPCLRWLQFVLARRRERSGRILWMTRSREEISAIAPELLHFRSQIETSSFPISFDMDILLTNDSEYDDLSSLLSSAGDMNLLSQDSASVLAKGSSLDRKSSRLALSVVTNVNSLALLLLTVLTSYAIARHTPSYVRNLSISLTVLSAFLVPLFLVASAKAAQRLLSYLSATELADEYSSLDAYESPSLEDPTKRINRFHIRVLRGDRSFYQDFIKTSLEASRDSSTIEMLLSGPSALVHDISQFCQGPCTQRDSRVSLRITPVSFEF